VRTDIGNLNDTLFSVSHFPHGYIGRTALLEVTVMPSRAKPAIIGPITSDRSLQFNLTQECYKTLLDPQRQSSNLDASIDFDCPYHRGTIPKKGIVSTAFGSFYQVSKNSRLHDLNLPDQRGVIPSVLADDAPMQQFSMHHRLQSVDEEMVTGH
jgi:hypothetical protein